ETAGAQSLSKRTGANYITDKVFFNLLGIKELLSLDSSEYENADIVHDFKFSDTTLSLYDSGIWSELKGDQQSFPLFDLNSFIKAEQRHPLLNFVSISLNKDISQLPDDPSIVWVLFSENLHRMADQRRFIFELMNQGSGQPVILQNSYSDLPGEKLLLLAASQAGGILNDGLADGLWLESKTVALSELNDISFGILQASRTRMTRTEYIACPSCGRTLFDLEMVTAEIRSLTSHLKGVKIGIMGCVVNGPGEMADADFGFVGTGPGKISLYRGQNIVRPHIPQEGAVVELIELIKSEGFWVDP
ncbi:flavodoxin-dependent (E)-4-hydroxy-3-methylbut-2-enyl-diphosphate synthase, partial [bacterium]|nr:flavodoxin-dependent (E)-4-hydroxy-3-methylbut-2-enyl-diphosphate synthase [bacterium]